MGQVVVQLYCHAWLARMDGQRAGGAGGALVSSLVGGCIILSLCLSGHSVLRRARGGGTARMVVCCCRLVVCWLLHGLNGIG